VRDRERGRRRIGRRGRGRRASPRPRATSPVALAGGLLVGNASYRERFRHALAARGLPADPLAVVREPAEGALRIALDRFSPSLKGTPCSAPLRAGRGALSAPALGAADDPPPPPREFRGVWVATVANIDWPSKPGLPADKQKAELLAIFDKAVD
jgi:hypothetical protein